MHKHARKRVDVTARVTTLKGADAGTYYVEALPNYYLDSGEPAGIWHGRGAEMLGLNGEIDDREFLAVMAGLDPRARGEAHLGRVYGESSVRGFDITASAPKSVSVLFAIGDDHIRHQVLESHDAAVAAMLGWVEQHAHTRFRINGEIAIVDAEGTIAATFRQHTSRALDPQLHTHAVVANKVRSPDGRWLALDARTLKLDQRTLSAIYHATLRSELTGRLGVEWTEVVNGIANVAHVPDPVLEEFSSRTTDVQRRRDEKLDRFIDTLDRRPTPRERWRLEREAVLDSRPAKSHSLNADSLHAGWIEQVEDLGHEPERLVDAAIGRIEGRLPDPRAMTETMRQAIDTLSEKQSSWRPAELTREIAAALPTNTHVDPSRLLSIVDDLANIAIRQHCVDISRPIPDGVQLRSDGRPLTESIADRALTTAEILTQEDRLLDWAEHRMNRDAIDSAHATGRSPVELTGPQAETAQAVAGTADLVLVVGPAGTGKTTALAPAVEQLKADGRAVFGVAPSAAAADVLAVEAGITADTIDKLIIEHSLHREPEPAYDLPSGATIIVDEAGMLSTDKLHALASLADRRHWRVALVGDPLQFSAVGRGGMFEHLIDTHGAIELDQVHRFSNDWEAQASLRLRRGDPTVADLYDAHGRLHGGTTTRMQREALEAWWQARQQGEAVVLSTPTNDTAASLNRSAQQLRVDACEIDPTSRAIETSSYRLYCGDEIATRHNDRLLRTDRGHFVRNRDTWIISTVHRNGDLTVKGIKGRTRLPAHYLQAHVELAYARTGYGTQARTEDRSILLLDGASDSRGVYVPMTRGRHHNTAYIVTTGDQTPAEAFAEAISHTWIDRPAHARQAELADQPPPPSRTSRPDRIRTLLDQHDRLTTTIRQRRAEHDRLARSHATELAHHDRLVDELESARSRLENATANLHRYDRPLRRRGHQHHIDDARYVADTHPALIDNKTAAVQQTARRLRDPKLKLTRHTATVAHTATLQAQFDDVETELARQGYDPDRIPPRRADRAPERIRTPRLNQHREPEPPDLGIEL